MVLEESIVNIVYMLIGLLVIVVGSTVGIMAYLNKRAADTTAKFTEITNHLKHQDGCIDRIEKKLGEHVEESSAAIKQLEEAKTDIAVLQAQEEARQRFEKMS